MIELIEPMWGQSLLLVMHRIMENPLWAEILPVVADVFVFVYPVYLVVLYGCGMYTSCKMQDASWRFFAFISKWIPARGPEWHNRYNLKESALWIFLAGILSTGFNILVQFFLVKDRPDVVMDLLYQKREDLILYDYLPSASFPSDHATMSMAIAVATLLWGLRYKKKGYVYFSVFLFAISLIMGWARISIGIHWPTDVIGGYVVGIFIPIMLFFPKVYGWVKKWVIDRLVGLEEKIVSLFFGGVGK